MSSTQALRLRSLARAAEIAGEARLASYLRVPPSTLESLLSGAEPIPERVFLKVVDFLIDGHILPLGTKNENESWSTPMATTLGQGTLPSDRKVNDGDAA